MDSIDGDSTNQVDLKTETATPEAIAPVPAVAPIPLSLAAQVMSRPASSDGGKGKGRDTPTIAGPPLLVGASRMYVTTASRHCRID